MDLIVPLLDKFTDSSLLSVNIWSQRGMLLLDGPKGATNILIITRGRLG